MSRGQRRNLACNEAHVSAGKRIDRDRLIDAQTISRRGRSGICDQPASQGCARNEVWPEEEVAAGRIGGNCGKSYTRELDVIYARTRKDEIDPGVVALDRRGDGLRPVDDARKSRIAVRRSIGISDDIQVVIAIQDEP